MSTRAAAHEVLLRLNDSQVAQVVEAADAARQLPSRLSTFEDPRALTTSSLLEDRKISRSLLLGLVVLVCLPADRSERGVKELARDVKLPISTTYRYIHTLVAVGLVEQNPQTRRYRRTPLSSHTGSSGRTRDARRRR